MLMTNTIQRRFTSLDRESLVFKMHIRTVYGIVRWSLCRVKNQIETHILLSRISNKKTDKTHHVSYLTRKRTREISSGNSRWLYMVFEISFMIIGNKFNLFSRSICEDAFETIVENRKHIVLLYNDFRVSFDRTDIFRFQQWLFTIHFHGYLVESVVSLFNVRIFILINIITITATRTFN